MRFLSLVFATMLVLASRTPAEACMPPPLEHLIRMSRHVALVQVVARHEVRDTRVVEYEVVHAFHGDPPARFVLFDPPEPEPPEEDAPALTDWAVLFLDEEAYLSAAWSSWDELARFTADTSVLGMHHLEPVLRHQDQLGVVSEVMMEDPFLLHLLELQLPPPSWMPLDAYTDLLERKAERVRTHPEGR